MANLNIDNLIELASKSLGVTPESLRQSLKNGDVEGITAKMSESDRKKVNEVLNNPKMAEKFKKQYTENK
ncbi:MAG: hypothetical protein IJ385_01970 [Ruminiclostridium sp.]|nr:hypothetical protein [Ruminiclostridium sp.]